MTQERKITHLTISKIITELLFALTCYQLSAIIANKTDTHKNIVVSRQMQMPEIQKTKKQMMDGRTPKQRDNLI